MMKTIMIFLFLPFSQVFADDNLIDARGMSLQERIQLKADVYRRQTIPSVPVDTQTDNFFKELKKGIVGIPSMRKMVFGDSKEVEKLQRDNKMPTQNDSFSKLQVALLEEDGDVRDYRKTKKEVLLDGNYIREVFVVEYENGRKQEIEFLFINAVEGGEPVLMEVNVNNR